MSAVSVQPRSNALMLVAFVCGAGGTLALFVAWTPWCLVILAALLAGLADVASG